jgi:hypothetical protein
MINRALTVKQELKLLLSDEEDIGSISEQEWVDLAEICKFLQIFELFSTSACGDKYATISDIYPRFNHLMTYLEQFLPKFKKSSNVTKSLLSKAALALEKIDEYYNLTNNAYFITTLLDPHFKLRYFEDDANQDSQNSASVKKMYFL